MGYRLLRRCLQIVFAAMLLNPAWSFAQDLKGAPTPSRPFPLPVKFVGYIVTQDKTTALLEIDGRTFVVLRAGERKACQFMNSTIHSTASKGTPPKTVNCKLEFSESSLDVDSKTLDLGLGDPWDHLICPLGETVDASLAGSVNHETPKSEKNSEPNNQESSEATLDQPFDKVFDLPTPSKPRNSNSF